MKILKSRLKLPESMKTASNMQMINDIVNKYTNDDTVYYKNFILDVKHAGILDGGEAMQS